MASGWAASAQSAPTLRLLPGAAVYIGDTLHDPDERPVQQVQIRPFQLGAYEVTVREFAAFVQSSGYRTQAETGTGSYAWDSTGWTQHPLAHWLCDEASRLLPDSAWQRPVTHISWVDAAQYCNWLSQRESCRPVYTFQRDTVRADLSADGYRLPTEAEWEYAAAGGFPPKKYRYAGSDDLRQVGWFSNNSARHAHTVGGKTPNAFGLYDLCGNVWEWCHDRYFPTRRPADRQTAAPADSSLRVPRALRGGSFSNNAAHCRITNRSSRYPDYRDANTGFRVARSNPAPRQ